MTQVKADITAVFGGSSYSTRIAYDVMDLFVDSALDTDTDAWQLTVGDFKNQLTSLLHRDTEVRCNFHVVGDGKFDPLHSGIADEVAWNDEGVMVISGRDFTSVAVDSTHPPARYKHGRPHIIVEKEAKALGIGGSLRLTTTKKFNTLDTDGNESYWQFWYRCYRKRRMWMWAEPDGTLVGSMLNYDQHPSYYFGDKFGLPSKYNRFNFIPVERMEWRANKSQRLETVYVIGAKGNGVGFVGKAVDPSMKRWIKKPISIMPSKSSHGPNEANWEAREELFESKVGSTEITITIMNPGLIIRQNMTCFLNISKANVRGEFFVVGTKILGNVDQGIVQQVRLRELNYAISRRVPTDPKLLNSPGDRTMYGTPGNPGNPAGSVVIGINTAITNAGGDKSWGYYFVEAADKHRGPWPFALYLGVLLSIAKHETNFQNIRHGGMAGPEFPGTANGHIPSIVTENAAYNKFVSRYANDPKYGLIDHIEAVGPMQLYSTSFKEYADRLGGGPPDEFGGRWVPKWNIMAAAYALRIKLKRYEAALDPGNKTQAYSLIWRGVADYGEGMDTALEMKKIYDDQFQTAVDEAIKSAQATVRDSGRVNWTFAFAQQATGGKGTNLGGPAAHQARPFHNWQSDNAYDIGVPIGTSVYSLSGGEIGPRIGISDTRPKDGARLTVGDLYWYGHLSSIAVKAGQKVKKGELLGKSGASANGVAHLHVGYNDGGTY